MYDKGVMPLISHKAITVRVSTDLHAFLVGEATKAGMSLSAFIRARLEGAGEQSYRARFDDIEQRLERIERMLQSQTVELSSPVNEILPGLDASAWMEAMVNPFLDEGDLDG